MNSNFAIIIIGLPGSGKTTISNKLNEFFSCFYCSIDIIRSKLFDENTIKKDRDYSEAELQLIYNATLYITELQSENKNNLIIDGVFRSKKIRKRLTDILNRNGYQIYKFYITCSDNVAIERVIKRKREGTSSPAGIAGYWKIKKMFEVPINEEFVVIDNSKDSTDIADLIIEKVKNIHFGG